MVREWIRNFRKAKEEVGMPEGEDISDLPPSKKIEIRRRIIESLSKTRRKEEKE